MEEVRSPMATDQILKDWLAREIGVELSEQPEAGSQVLKLKAVAKQGRTPDINRAVNRVRELLKPATDSDLEDALMSLEQSTGKRRDEGEDAADMKLDRYVFKLRDYPADVVMHTLQTWDDRPAPLGTFFPHWRDLKSALDAAFAWRRRVLPALQGFDASSQQTETRTPEEIEADKQGVRRTYLEAMRRLGSRPRRDLLPDDVEIDELETRAEPKPERTSPAGSILAKRIERIIESERFEIERALHPEIDDASH